jgi:putative MATE family efflux protein
LSTANRNLTAAPVPALIRQLAIPASVGMFFNTMYNVVDTYYAGQLSTDALAALSLTFPVYFSLLAMGMGFSTGATALIGNALGRDDRAEAALTASQGLIMSVLLAVVIMTTGYLAAPALFRLLGAREEYLDLCLQYIHVILGGSGMTLFVFMFNSALNAQGDTHSYRDYLIVATVANIILDPWFMYGGLGVPAMGVRGIAVATVLVQVFGACFLGWRVRRTGLIYRSAGARWRPDRRVLRAIIGQGVPASLNMMTVALGIFIITYFLSGFGQKTVAAYGAATRIEQIVLLPALGLNVAALTLAAQNGGAGLFVRVRSTVRYALFYGAAVMMLGAAIVFFGASPLMNLFSDDPEVVDIGVRYLRIAAFIQHAYVFLFINTSLLQGLKKPAFALWIGLYRQLIMPPILFYLVTRVFDLGLMGIWWGIFGITWSAAVVAVLYARSQVDKMARSAEVATVETADETTVA